MQLLIFLIEFRDEKVFSSISFPPPTFSSHLTFSSFLFLPGPTDGDLPGQSHAVTDCPQREACQPVNGPQR